MSSVVFMWNKFNHRWAHAETMQGYNSWIRDTGHRVLFRTRTIRDAYDLSNNSSIRMRRSEKLIKDEDYE